MGALAAVRAGLAASPVDEQFATIAAPRNRVAYRGVAVVPGSYGS
jgi:hypothetical protein